MDRTILHVDLNNFYASVEVLHNKHYRSVPMAVTGNIELRHGIVLAKNQIAKQMGVKTGDTVIEARLKCPNIEFCPANFSLYLRFSQMARAIYERFTDKVESFGIDECWLDVTASTKLFGDGKQIADTIRETLLSELGITASVGVSYNKIFAKLGSDYKKPNATTCITRENYKQIAYPQPVENLIFVGKATKQKLNHIGIKTIEDLANADEKMLVNLLGVWGKNLHKFANGEDDSDVRYSDAYSVIKSVGNSTTTRRDMQTPEDVKYVINLLSESVASRLKQYGLKGTVVALYLRYSTLDTINKQISLKVPTNSSALIAEQAFNIFLSMNKQKLSFRSLGVQVTNLIKSEECEIQLDMFNDATNLLKREKLETGIDNIRAKFGHNIIKKAILYTDESLTELSNPKEENVIHPIGFRK